MTCVTMLLFVFHQIAEESARAAEKRAVTMEEEVKSKNEQLEELYAQVDEMQECITQLEGERAEQQTLVGKL